MGYIVLRALEEFAIYYIGVSAIFKNDGRKDSKRLPEGTALVGISVMFAGAFWINCFVMKFCPLEYLVAWIISTVLIVFLFDEKILSKILFNLLYWVYILGYRFLFAQIGVYFTNSLDMEIYNRYSENWCFMEAVEAVLLILLIVSFRYLMDRNSLQDRWELKQTLYVLGIILFFDLNYWVFKYISSFGITFDIICLACYVMGSVFFLFSVGYAKEQISQLKLVNNQEILVEQYNLLKINYYEKRKALHDELQQNALLAEYIRNDRKEDALKLLQQQEADYRATAVPSITGIVEMDLLIQNKKRQMEQKNIQFTIQSEIYYNPFSVNDWCILFGNMVDNAVEEVEKLPRKDRKIWIKLANRNHMFFMEMRNAVATPSIKVGNHFLSNKMDWVNHGIGMESCKTIVKKYGGELEIYEEQKEFVVKISIYDI